MRCTIRISCRPCAPSQHSDTWPDTWPTHPFFSEQTAHSGPPKNLHSNARACELLGSAAAVVNLNIPQLPPAPPSLPLPLPPPEAAGSAATTAATAAAAAAAKKGGKASESEHYHAMYS